MKMLIEKFAKYFGFLFLTMVLLCNFGCTTSKSKPDPLAGWKPILNEEPKSAISKDYQAFIQQLPPDERNYGGPVFYFGDGTGQHAVTFEVDKYGKDAWNYFLFYDRDDKRTKVLKYHSGRYWNP
jgi:hypothetical protein